MNGANALKPSTKKSVEALAVQVGSGEWVKRESWEIIRKKRLIERLGKIASGDPVDTVLQDGQFVMAAAPLAVQVRAIEELLDRGFGKSAQPIEGEIFHKVLQIERADGR